MGDGIELRADCERCFGLCCVAPAFSASADFAIDKAAGEPCPNLGPAFGCGIHASLRAKGFPGCTAYYCFGAGQHIAQVTFAGRSWRDAPETADAMFRAFAVMRALHELLWHVVEALGIEAAASLRPDLTSVRDRLAACTAEPAESLLALDVGTVRSETNAVLLRVSEQARAGLDGADHRGADLVGADLRRADLRGANLRGALLLGADLRHADLSAADVTGADLRAADLRGADLGTTLFLTQAQLDAARGDAATRRPSTRDRPDHWAG